MTEGTLTDERLRSTPPPYYAQEHLWGSMLTSLKNEHMFEHLVGVLYPSKYNVDDETT